MLGVTIASGCAVGIDIDWLMAGFGLDSGFNFLLGDNCNQILDSTPKIICKILRVKINAEENYCKAKCTYFFFSFARAISMEKSKVDARRNVTQTCTYHRNTTYPEIRKISEFQFSKRV